MFRTLSYRMSALNGVEREREMLKFETSIRSGTWTKATNDEAVGSEYYNRSTRLSTGKRIVALRYQLCTRSDGDGKGEHRC